MGEGLMEGGGLYFFSASELEAYWKGGLIRGWRSTGWIKREREMEVEMAIRWAAECLAHLSFSNPVARMSSICKVISNLVLHFAALDNFPFVFHRSSDRAWKCQAINQ